MKLVIGASGFLGSHVVRELAAAGEPVRILVRETSDTTAIDDLVTERMTGDLFDAETVAAAMAGVDTVFYCVVDTRSWLRDPAPLFETNVEALRAVLDVAIDAELRRFVFTSTMATIGRVSGRESTEEDAFNWRGAPAYVKSRVAAEDLVLRYARELGLPAVAMCVANTYGPGDTVPTPHGAFVAAAALGKLPFTIKGARSESVGIADAARALVLAGRRGRPGHRYIVAERYIDLGEVIATAAAAAGVARPRVTLRRSSLYLIGALGSAASAVTRKSYKLSLSSVRLMHRMPRASHAKATRELGWRPAPVAEAIAAGAHYWVELRDERRRISALRSDA